MFINNILCYKVNDFIYNKLLNFATNYEIVNYSYSFYKKYDTLLQIFSISINEYEFTKYIIYMLEILKINKFPIENSKFSCNPILELVVIK